MGRGGNNGLSTGAEKALHWSSGLRDGLGLGLDPEMNEPVAALHLLDIETEGSCQGHQDRGMPFPWIDTRASQEERAAIQKHLPGFHFVEKGFGPAATWRLVPLEVSSITEGKPQGDWDRARAELRAWAQDVLRGRIRI
jgi:hypothetical protein